MAAAAAAVAAVAAAAARAAVCSFCRPDHVTILSDVAAPRVDTRGEGVVKRESRGWAEWRDAGLAAREVTAGGRPSSGTRFSSRAGERACHLREQSRGTCANCR